jgi:hypothetical protein
MLYKLKDMPKLAPEQSNFDINIQKHGKLTYKYNCSVTLGYLCKCNRLEAKEFLCSYLFLM